MKPILGTLLHCWRTGRAGYVDTEAEHRHEVDTLRASTAANPCYNSIVLNNVKICTSCLSYSQYVVDGACGPLNQDICTPMRGTADCESCAPGYMLFLGGCFSLAGPYAQYICEEMDRYTIDNVVYCSKCAYSNYVPTNGFCESTSPLNTCANNVCTDCWSGFLFNGGCVSSSSTLGKIVCTGKVSNGKCTECADGFVTDDDGFCILCAVKNCANCQTSTEVCDTCKAGYFLDDGTCKICRHHCSVCSLADTCITCRANAQEYMSGSEKVCIGCADTANQYGFIGVSNCKTCSLPSTPGVVSCLECAANTYSYKDDSNTLHCYTSCPLGMYPDSSTRTCKKCVENCLRCNSPYICNECIPGYYDNINECKPCTTSGCYACGFGDVCKVCKTETPHMNLAGTACIAECPEHSLFNTTSTQQCTCRENYGLTDKKDACVPCSDKFCRVCTNNTTQCEICMDGSRPYNRACPTSNCAEHCLQCQNAGSNLCDVCQDGYQLTDGRLCVECSDQHCLACAENTGVCTKCRPGFRITSTGSCAVCGRNCKSCNESTCLACEDRLSILSLDGLDCVLSCPSHSTEQAVAGSTMRMCTCTHGYSLDDEKKACVEDSKRCPIGCTCDKAPLCSGCKKHFFEKNPDATDHGRCQSCAVVTADGGLQGVVGCKSCRKHGDTVLCSECLENYKQHIVNGVMRCLKACPAGTHDTDSVCLDCTVTACAQCDTEVQTCTTCIDGHYLENNACYSCHSLTCARCDLPNVCTECLDTSVCSACGVANCRTCSASGECQECEEGFIGPNCQPCGEHCSICSSEDANTCLKCQAGSILSNGVCYNTCKEGSTSGHCAIGHCSKVMGGCSKCAISTEYPINGVCTTNKHSNTCDDGQCTACAAEYFLYGPGCYSLNTAPGSAICVQATNGVCTRCHRGYSLQQGHCVPCNAVGCVECSADPSICTACRQQSDVVDPAGSSCVSSCGIQGFGMSPVSRHCVPCTDQNCLDCDAAAVSCQWCKEGYYLINGICSACHNTCRTCSGPGETDCLTCVAGKAHSSGAGAGACIDGCLVSIGNCLKCDAIIFGTAYCSQCTGGLYPINGHCQPNIATRGAVCLGVENGSCTRCTGGYFIYSGGCYQQDRQPGSEICEAVSLYSAATEDANRGSVAAGTCTRCKLGYALVSGVCTPCTSPNCRECNPSVNACTECANGYYGDTCIPCPETCATCSSKLHCTKCKAGYFSVTTYKTFSSASCISCSNTTGLNGFLGEADCLTCVAPVLPGKVLCLTKQVTPSPDGPEHGSGVSSSNKTAIIAGCVTAGVIVLFVCVSLLVWCLLLKKRSRKQKDYILASASLNMSVSESMIGSFGSRPTAINDLLSVTTC